MALTDPGRLCIMCQARHAAGDDGLLSANQALTTEVLRLRRLLNDCYAYEVITSWGGDPIAEVHQLRARVMELEDTVNRLNRRRTA